MLEALASRSRRSQRIRLCLTAFEGVGRLSKSHPPPSNQIFVKRLANRSASGVPVLSVGPSRSSCETHRLDNGRRDMRHGLLLAAPFSESSVEAAGDLGVGDTNVGCGALGSNERRKSAYASHGPRVWGWRQSATATVAAWRGGRCARSRHRQRGPAGAVQPPPPPPCALWPGQVPPRTGRLPQVWQRAPCSTDNAGRFSWFECVPGLSATGPAWACSEAGLDKTRPRPPPTCTGWRTCSTALAVCPLRPAPGPRSPHTSTGPH